MLVIQVLQFYLWTTISYSTTLLITTTISSQLHRINEWLWCEYAVHYFNDICYYSSDHSTDYWQRQHAPSKWPPCPFYFCMLKYYQNSSAIILTAGICFSVNYRMTTFQAISFCLGVSSSFCRFDSAHVHVEFPVCHVPKCPFLLFPLGLVLERKRGEPSE